MPASKCKSFYQTPYGYSLNIYQDDLQGNLDDILMDGNGQARKVAQGTMDKVREIIKLPKF